MKRRPISPRLHGLFDYASVILLLVAGPLLHMGNQPAMLASTVAGSLLVYSAFTDYPMGFVKMMPFTVHRALDIVTALGFLVSPRLFRFSADSPATAFFLVYGFAALVIVVLTDFRVAKA